MAESKTRGFINSIFGWTDKPLPMKPADVTPRQMADMVGVVDPSRLISSSLFKPYNPSVLVSRKGLSIFDEMKRDEQVKACLAFKKSAMLSGGWEVVSPADQDDDWEVTQFVRDTLDNFPGGFHKSLKKVLTALDYGYSVTEKVYGDAPFAEGKKVLQRMVAMKPHYIDLAANPQGTLIEVHQLPVVGSGNAIVMPPGKFVIYTHGMEFENHYGIADLESCYRPWWVKDNAYKWFAVMLERFGMPPVFAMYNPNVITGSLVEDLKKIVRNIQNATMGVLPRPAKDDLELWSQQLGAGSREIFLSALSRFDADIARALLVPSLIGMGGDGGSSGGDVSNGSLARSQTHFKSFMSVIAEEQKDVSATVNDHVIHQLCDLNFPDLKSYPLFKLMPVDDDTQLAVYELWSKLVAGKIVNKLPDDEIHLRKALGFPENENPEVIEDDVQIDQSTGLPVSIPRSQAMGGKPFGGAKPKPKLDKDGKPIKDDKVLPFKKKTFAWNEGDHPRHPAGSDKGGEFAPAAEDDANFWKGGLKQKSYDPDLVTPDARVRIEKLYDALDGLWESPNGKAADDIYLVRNGSSKNLTVAFSGRVYDAFTPRRGVEDDDHPAVNKAVFGKTASKLQAAAERVFPGAKVTVRPQEKSYISVDVDLPAATVLSGDLKLTGKYAAIPDEEQSDEMKTFAEANDGVWVTDEEGAAICVPFAEWREEDHPRHPEGDPQGGKFAPREEADASGIPPSLSEKYKKMLEAMSPDDRDAWLRDWRRKRSEASQRSRAKREGKGVDTGKALPPASDADRAAYSPESVYATARNNARLEGLDQPQKEHFVKALQRMEELYPLTPNSHIVPPTHGLTRPETMHNVRVDHMRIAYARGTTEAAADLMAHYGAINRPELAYGTKAVIISAQSHHSNIRRDGSRTNFTTLATAGPDGNVVFYNGEVKAKTLAHEMGHQTLRAVYGNTTPPLGSPLRKLWGDNPSKQDRASRRWNVSGYAGTNPSEFAAEAIGHVLTNPELRTQAGYRPTVVAVEATLDIARARMLDRAKSYQ